MVTVGDGQVPELEFRSLDVVRWHRCVIEAKSQDDPELILDAVIRELGLLRQDAEPSLWAVRVEVHGKCKAHVTLQARSAHWISEMRAQSLALDAERLWLEKVFFITAPDTESLAQTLEGPFEELLAVLKELRSDPKQLNELAGPLAELKRKLPVELTQSDDGTDPTNLDWLRGLLDRVEPVLRERLLSSEPTP